ncbi:MULTISPECIES: AMP-binding enzyme [unclassified Rhizobium]|uniref:AMP-binding enzyme n=1 Tax=unclassified Rhizobium TaxID=2613769 RepID=UPI001ADC2A76|nr:MULTISPECIES: hypothetical protein [unclassified Rhizobium]MBO9101189.1 hypothetical protein [Rhizobium sp. L58/93]MBO9186755.1 hypothetical protein [Rhizobium sp. E27B/91]QXZ86214.1 hypothetical protein J5287_24370 [Rhizobium sp. K1/93]QXZ92330.1 hypothetical protein J5280_24820 [Rhizobium sp. K15/93]QYA04454.1 hypothetical protein J5278_19930 [Rhizobium sp. B21/90]
MLMHGLLLDGATRHPDRDCFHWVDRNRGLTYGEAAELMGDFAGLLHELGVGDRSWYPRDIEEALCAIATIRDAALVGVPGDNGLRPVAAVMLSGVGPLDAAACKTHLSNTTSYDIDCLKIVVVKEMPMTPTGKIAKAELTQMLGSGTDVQN